LTLSTTPALDGDRLQPRHLVLRTYLAAQDDSFVMMPGGLTRFSASADTMVVSMQRGGGSKDTWMLSEAPVSDVTLLQPGGQPVALNRGGNDLPSRVADNLYWLGRYAERAEALTRLLRGIFVRLTETSGLEEARELPVLLRAVTEMSLCFPGFVGDGADERLGAPVTELQAVIHDAERAGSLAGVLAALCRVAGTVRDRISKDMWRVVNDLVELRPLALSAPTSRGPGVVRTLSSELDLLDRTVLTLAAFSGLAMESVTRGDGWRFLDIGRKLERALQLTNLLQSTLVSVTTPEIPLLEALLEIADSSMTYRRRYQGSLQAAAVLDLLLADETNPRSLGFQLAALAENVERLPRDAKFSGRSIEQRLMLASLTTLRLAEADVLVQADGANQRPNLEQLLAELKKALPALSNAITQTHLSHLQTSRHLASPTA
ncbi:MAG TPA: circularly permuted type 2 ATP-grasp protein, partial [Planctomycetaceae bacterium]|nr:circularly permuted type 2 ATP-grasp protein [Planctomycetaceae bacterium]